MELTKDEQNEEPTTEIEEIEPTEEEIEAFEEITAEDAKKMSEALSSIKVDASDVVLTKVDKKKLDDANEIADLYAEFNDFIEVKGEMKSEVGIKRTVSTGLDVLDAMLGGGFPVGALSIIVGNPGSGKCLCYEEEIEIYIND